MQFIPFFEYAFWDSIANKGFFSVVLQHVNGKKIQIVNTHLQSDSELSLLYNITRIYYTNHVRTRQLEEIVKMYGTSELPTVIIGDLNQVGLIHPRIQNICCTHRDSIVTFPSTGENLDHAAWITGTGLLPHLQRCHVHNKVTHSDHSPIVFTICPQ
jgi:endonuclease/exonuclease/phosphatase family metal-dependent hydrolase